MSKIVRNEKISFNDDVIKRYLHITEAEKPEESIRKLQTKAGNVLARVHCPKCDGIVKDIEGVYDEICTWCGYRLKTER